ncbi:MAG: ABC transporter permease [Algibacter sp.]|uniref:ABC transporter permease n=1 Tax=Algibacter sp. TaxID=1872428 RepID=UPI0026385E01|nr:ABC transporter permease [Algibacter sp.]MDG1730564.1 ABC transporter permease [Algibacter sp.]MDG2177551.1 ABC transporter permease [Algibacter sp.]
MFDLDLWREIFQSINKNKTRALLSGFTVAFAIMLFTILFGIANGLENTFEKFFIRRAENAINIRFGTTSKPYKGLQIGRQIQPTSADLIYLKKEFGDNIEYISSKISRGYQVKYKKQKGGYTISGVSPDYQYIEKAEIEDGRFISLKDIYTKDKVCVIGRLVEEDLFLKESAMGKYIDLEGVQYKVVGVYSDGGGDSQERVIYAPYTTIQRLYLGNDDIGNISLTYNPNLSVDQALALVKDMTVKLKNKFDIAPNDQRGIRIGDGVLNAKKRLDNISSGLGALIPIIGFGTLIAGILGISNIMIFIVKERTKEIGIRKALGASPKSIVSIILLESILITAITGYIGLLIGVGILKAVGSSLERYFITNPSVNSSILLTATIVLIIAGAIAGFLPAKRASKIKPIIALRDG